MKKLNITVIYKYFLRIWERRVRPSAPLGSAHGATAKSDDGSSAAVDRRAWRPSDVHNDRKMKNHD